MRIGVLASGKGAGLRAILADGLDVSVVAVDRPCPATGVAADHGVAWEVVPRGVRTPAGRAAFTRSLVRVLERHGVELVVMAGFMTVLAEPMFERYGGRVLNLHPSLLPDFRGLHAVEDALAAGVAVTGCTVHIAVPEVDAGPVLAQEPVPVLPGDTPQSLERRIQEVEHRLYPATIRAFMAHRAPLRR
ncbi:phosphoribosylglycinamide formyltransferase [Actinomadura vinacea]|uniref:Phosphoribosylglycinamide formyltransferase n=1 Tax=Actinomadura vinacea TaxID=115336 RepID=A0ABP5X623_9ACTN